MKFQVSGIGGTLGPHNYTMDFGDGQFGELTLDPHDSMSAVFSHVYTESAYFKQSVTVNDSIGGLGEFNLLIVRWFKSFYDRPQILNGHQVYTESLVLGSNQTRDNIYMYLQPVLKWYMLSGLCMKECILSVLFA